MGHRYYDPAIGRFLSPDPAGDGDNWYAYCGNDPIDKVDPTGLLPDMIDGIAVGLPGFISATAPGTYGDKAAKYRIEGVYRIHYDANGNRMPGEIPQFLYNIAIPLNVSLTGNLEAARNFSNTHGVGQYRHIGGVNLGQALSITAGMFSAAKASFNYVKNNVANGSGGNYKNGVSPDTMLWQLLDNGGNFNAGMVEQGLGMNIDQVKFSGQYAHVVDHGLFNFSGGLSQYQGGGGYFDQRLGQQILMDGFQYASQTP